MMRLTRAALALGLLAGLLGCAANTPSGATDTASSASTPTVAPARLDFLKWSDGPNPPGAELKRYPGTWSAATLSTTAPWISTRVDAPFLHLSVDGAGLGAGVFDGELAVSTGPGAVDIPVRLTVSSQGPQASLEAPTSYGSGEPIDLAVADLNADGFPDIVSANGESGTVSVLLGSGGRAFRPPMMFPAGSYPQGLVVGDFNRDGHLDVAVACGGSPSSPGQPGVSVLLGDGSGALGPPTNVFFASSGSIAAGDVDGDGNLDLIVGSGAGTHVDVLLGSGRATFVPARGVAGAGLPIGAVRVADFNGDGRLDIAVAALSDRTDLGVVSIFLGMGGGAFSAASELSAGSSPSGMVVADLNGDGIVDLAVSDYNAIALLLGTGDGSFRTLSGLVVGSGCPPVIADFNGDGVPDLVVGNNGSAGPNSLLLGRPANTVSVYLGRGGGSFWPPRDIATADKPCAAVAADFDRDGRVDLAVGHIFSSKSVSLLLAR